MGLVDGVSDKAAPKTTTSVDADKAPKSVSEQMAAAGFSGAKLSKELQSVIGLLCSDIENAGCRAPSFAGAPAAAEQNKTEDAKTAGGTNVSVGGNEKKLVEALEKKLGKDDAAKLKDINWGAIPKDKIEKWCTELNKNGNAQAVLEEVLKAADRSAGTTIKVGGDKPKEKEAVEPKGKQAPADLDSVKSKVIDDFVAKNKPA